MARELPEIRLEIDGRPQHLLHRPENPPQCLVIQL